MNRSCETEWDCDLGEINVQEIYDIRYKIRRKKNRLIKRSFHGKIVPSANKNWCKADQRDKSLYLSAVVASCYSILIFSVCLWTFFLHLITQFPMIDQSISKWNETHLEKLNFLQFIRHGREIEWKEMNK